MLSGTHVHWLGGDDSERLAASFDLSGHLAPGADVAPRVSCHVSLGKDTQNGKKDAAMKKKRSEFFLFVNSAGFSSGVAQQPSRTWKQVEYITEQTTSEEGSTGHPAEGDRNTLQTQRWHCRQSKGSTSRQSSLEQGSDALATITCLMSRSRSFTMGRFKISRMVL